MSDEIVDPAKPDLATMKARMVCSCGFVASGRSAEASHDGYVDHIRAAHGQVPLDPAATLADVQKAMA